MNLKNLPKVSDSQRSEPSWRSFVVCCACKTQALDALELALEDSSEKTKTLAWLCIWRVYELGFEAGLEHGIDKAAAKIKRVLFES